MFVKHTKLENHEEDYNLPTLLLFYRKSFMDTFHTSDPSGDEYDDGEEMLTKWFGRTTWDGVEVLSCEIKENFMVKTSVGDIPFNFIWDRHDKIGDGIYKVVDYKSNRWALRPDDLKKKVQARCYGLAAQIKYPDAKQIWVEFDMLRHDPVGIVYTREDNIATWKFIKELAEKIIATAPAAVLETLNPECRFCVRKQVCGALQRNIASGGVFTVTGAADAVDRRAALEYQIAAINSAIAELDDIILTEARATDVMEFESDMNKLEITIGSRRSVDAGRVEAVIGTEAFEKYGSKSITLAELEKMTRPANKDFTPEQKKQLKGLIYMKKGEPKVKVSAKNALDED
jgi:hypothetical protein